MPKINVLPKSIAELIAAGEVVEKPASVVKELIENSIDAGATAVTVEIKNGGTRYIRVTDNGCGISYSDVPLAFISHATSKISEASDLDEIMTLGFRGEALPSIAAVSKLSLLTKTPDEETGASFEIEGGIAGEVTEAGCPVGTTFVVRDLFFNTPARMKFLKKDATEGIYVSDVVTKTSVAHPEVKFTFIKDGKVMLSTPGNGDMYDTVYSVLGKEIAEGLIKCEYEHESVTVSGFISKPVFNRPNRNYQYFYVNGRYVKIPSAAVALDDAYKNSIMVGKFPMCFLNITIPPGKIDVNVHPAKTEVRFSEEKTIFEAVYYAAKSALAKGDRARPEIGLPTPVKNPMPQPEKKQQYRFDTSGMIADYQEKKQTPPVARVIPVTEPPKVTRDRRLDIFPSEGEMNDKPVSAKQPYVSADRSTGAVFRDTSGLFSGNNNSANAPSGSDEFAVVKKNSNDKTAPEEDKSVVSSESEKTQTAEKNTFFADALVSGTAPVPGTITEEKKTAETTSPEIIPHGAGNINIVTDDVKSDTVRILGEIFETYILVERGEKLLIIDKHAAHERMIFNSLAKNPGASGSQLLMFPITVKLSEKEYAAVLENTEVFEQTGYSVEDFGNNCVIVRQCPMELCDSDIKDIITEMAGKLAAGSLRPVPEKLEWLYHSTSCRAAVKAGDILKDRELEVFVKTLLSDEDIKYCPHGRPVMYELSRHTIEKQFGRLG